MRRFFLWRSSSRSWGITLLSGWLIVTGVIGLAGWGNPEIATVLHVVAIAAGVLLFLGW
jgi:hypothetical protein